MKLPPTWGSNWFQNMSSLSEWCKCIKAFSAITKEDYKHYADRRAHNIEDVCAREAVLVHSPYLTDLLVYCHYGLRDHNERKDVPTACLLQNADILAYETAWQKHTLSEPQSLVELQTVVKALLDQLKTVRRDFLEQESGGYSSYSDYSDSETVSEEELEDK